MYTPMIRHMGETTRMAIMLDMFYGYVKLDDLKSIKWLVDHYKLVGQQPSDVFKGDREGPEIIFTPDEFVEWFDLYLEDIREYDYSDTDINYPEDYDPLWEYPNLEDMYYDDRIKIVTWSKED